MKNINIFKKVKLTLKKVNLTFLKVKLTFFKRCRTRRCSFGSFILHFDILGHIWFVRKVNIRCSSVTGCLTGRYIYK